MTIRQAEVSEIIVEDHKITGVKTYSGAVYHAKAVVLATGTYLKARCIYGDVSNATGPNGLQPANHLTDSLIANGIEMFRFRPGRTAAALIFPRWRSSSAISVWYRFRSPRIQSQYRRSRFPAG